MVHFVPPTPEVNASDSVYFLLAVIPPHFSRLPQLATELAAQHHRPVAIVVTVPEFYRRFGKANVSTYLHANESSGHVPIVANHVREDHGPLLKYYGASLVPQEATCVVGDDDKVFPRFFLSSLHRLRRSSSADVVWSGGPRWPVATLTPTSFRRNPTMTVKGFAGVAAKCAVFARLRFSRDPRCFHSDDIVATKALLDDGCVVRQVGGIRLGPTPFNHDRHSLFRLHAGRNFSLDPSCGQALGLTAANATGPPGLE